MKILNFIVSQILTNSRELTKNKNVSILNLKIILHSHKPFRGSTRIGKVESRKSCNASHAKFSIELNLMSEGGAL